MIVGNWFFDNYILFYYTKCEVAKIINVYSDPNKVWEFGFKTPRVWMITFQPKDPILKVLTEILKFSIIQNLQHTKMIRDNEF